MDILDAHTHFFSRQFFLLLAKQAAHGSAGSVELLGAVAAKAGLELPDEDVAAHRDLWLAQMKRHKLAHMVTFASLPEEAEVVAEAVAGSGGKLTGYFLANPMVPNADRFIDWALGTLGFRGVLLFPALHHFDIGDAALRPFLARLADAQAVCVVHCGALKIKLRDLMGLPRTADLRYANPLAVIPAANEFRAIRFVLPHFGGGFLREALIAGDMCENVLVDTSSSNDWIRTQVPAMTLADAFRAALAVFGAERILFGTDSSTFPRGWRADVYAAQKAALGKLKVPKAQQALIFGGNLTRLLARG